MIIALRTGCARQPGPTAEDCPKTMPRDIFLTVFHSAQPQRFRGLPGDLRADHDRKTKKMAFFEKRSLTVRC
jgi:hypothetical protein